MRRLFAVLLLAFLAAPAFGHLTPNSEIRIDIGPTHDMVDIIVPQGEYGYASGNRLGDVASARAWLDASLAVAGPDGRAWRIDWQTVEFVQIAGPPDLHAVARITPAPGTSPRAFTLRWTGVIDRVPSHFALAVLGTDFAGGKVGGDPLLIGALQGKRQSLSVSRVPSGLAAGFSDAIRLGMHHIAEGHDHLLFLVALLLPAPVLAAGRRWGGTRPVRSTLVKLGWIVTAFTIGHSLTLIGAAFFGWRLPAPPVESLIALSILVSAVHAWRPLFAGREAFVAGGFGLVHGLAFATVVGNLGLGVREKALSILGFNLGIELVQFGVVIAVLPGLMMLARTRWYAPFRNAGVLLAGVAAAGWLVERVSGTENVVAQSVDGFLTHAPWLVAAITTVAAGLFWCERRTARQSYSTP